MSREKENYSNLMQSKGFFTIITYRVLKRRLRKENRMLPGL